MGRDHSSQNVPTWLARIRGGKEPLQTSASAGTSGRPRYRKSRTPSWFYLGSLVRAHARDTALQARRRDGSMLSRWLGTFGSVRRNWSPQSGRRMVGV
jgi:hypothetical protein